MTKSKAFAWDWKQFDFQDCSPFSKLGGLDCSYEFIATNDGFSLIVLALTVLKFENGTLIVFKIFKYQIVAIKNCILVSRIARFSLESLLYREKVKFDVPLGVTCFQWFVAFLGFTCIKCQKTYLKCKH